MVAPSSSGVLHPAHARIDLTALAGNYRSVAAAVPAPVMPVVKADGYGHGAVPVARRLEAEGAPLFAVAYVREAAALRQGGLRTPIVVLTGSRPEEAEAVVANGLTPVVSSPVTMQGALAAGLLVAGGGLKAHVKVDTGMSRLGFTTSEMVDVASRLQASGVVEVEGVMTHLASADEDRAFTETQLDRFDDAVAQLEKVGVRARWVHACNSAGLAFFRPTHTLTRPGLILYGVPPRPFSPPIRVRPVMTVVSKVALIKDVPKGTPVSYGGRWVAPRPSRIATLSIGYADGVPRTDRMREVGAFTVAGRRVPVRGTVCMDLTMVDLTDRPEVGEDAEAVLLGDDPGAWDVADWAGTNAWEVLTSIGPRVPRVYLENGQPISMETPRSP